MNRFSQLTLIVMVSLFLGILLPSGEAAAEQKTFNEQVTGAWTYVAVDTVRPYGSRVPNITFHIEISPLPNWDGIGQKRPFAPKGDELKWTTAGTLVAARPRSCSSEPSGCTQCGNHQTCSAVQPFPATRQL
jgi:hypothetical protein